MQCSNPLHLLRFPDGSQTVVGLGKFKLMYPNGLNRSDIEHFEIPCGHCVACRLQRARTWANRCLLEASYHQQNSFLTLTYDNEHIPISTDSNGVQHQTLNKRDLQLFFKNLRSRGIQFRYYACGEYGSTTARPHYHVLMFGYMPSDLKFYKVDSQKHCLYTSEFLTSVWKNGYVVVGQLEWDSCCYTARYIMKKQLGDSAHIYQDLNITPEYCVMSRRPGIAFQYFNDHFEEFYPYDTIHLSTNAKAFKFKPPKYFDNLLKGYDADLFDRIRANRILAQQLEHEALLSRLNVPYIDYLHVKEKLLLEKLTALRRNYETSKN